MAAGFTLLEASGSNQTPAETSSATGAFAPAVGDIIFWGLKDYDTSADPVMTGNTGTWTRLLNRQAGGGGEDTLAIFRCTGAGSSAAQTVSEGGAAGGWLDFMWCVVRPVDLTYVGVAGSNDTSEGIATSLVVSLSTSSPAGLLGWGWTTYNSITVATDSGWTVLSDDVEIASCGVSDAQYRLSDDTEWIWDNSGNAPSMAGVLEFSAAASGLQAIRDFELAIQRSWEKVGRIFVPENYGKLWKPPTVPGLVGV